MLNGGIDLENLLIIDGNSILNRAFYALPLFKSLDGRFDNAVFGFTKMLLNLITTNKPDYILVAFDKGKNTFRHRSYADYKAGRMKMPEELKSQFQILRKKLSFAGFFLKIKSFNINLISS